MGINVDAGTGAEIPGLIAASGSNRPVLRKPSGVIDWDHA
jgi:hypothetical protein